jgi:hypothetical protein
MLGRPLEGLTELPDAVSELGFRAERIAARRVVEAALARKVDLVILAGDLVLADQCGPGGLLALVELLEPLAAAKIPVVWAIGRGDPVPWPDAIDLPDAVVRFPVDRPRKQSIKLADGRSVTVMACGAKPDTATLVALLATADDGDPVIVTSSLPQQDLSTTIPGIEYWAGPQPGAAQPRSFGQTTALPGKKKVASVGGAWFVELAPGEEPQVEHIPTAAVSFHEITLEIASDETLPTLLRQANEALGDAPSGIQCQVVRLTLSGDGAATESFLDAARRERVRQAVNSHWAKREVPAFCTEVLTDPAAVLESNADDPTGLLSAYVRQLRDWSQAPDSGPPIADMLDADGVPAESWPEAHEQVNAPICAEAATWGLLNIGPDQQP